MDEQPALEPIILNPIQPNQEKEAVKPSRGKRWLRTFFTMFLGWFIGNLILGSILGLLLIYSVGSTGLVNIPLLTKAFFSQPEEQKIDEKLLAEAQEKINKITALSEGQTIPELQLTQDEVNALLMAAFSKPESTIINPSLEMAGSKFYFDGFFKNTGAPVHVEGEIDTSLGLLRLNYSKTVFGKVNMPTQISNLVLSGAFERVGLSLENTPIPARSLLFTDGQIVLKDITKVQ